jgi:hypothetical protein
LSDRGVAVTDTTREGTRALDALESTLHAHREAMTAGDLPAMDATQARIRALLSDPHWRACARADAVADRLRGALRDTALDASLAARGQSHAGRALAALGLGPQVYTPAGSLARAADTPHGPRARGLDA